MVWQPCLVSVMDSNTIVQAAGAVLLSLQNKSDKYALIRQSIFLGEHTLVF